MGVVNIRTKGTYNSTMISLEDLSQNQIIDEETLIYFAEKGLQNLILATPVSTGETAASWSYEIIHKPNGRIELSWKNSNMAGSTPVVILIDRGHANSNNNWITGKHFIRAAIDPVLLEMSEYLDRRLRSK